MDKSRSTSVLLPVRPRSCERPPYPTTTTFPPYLAGFARATPDKWGEGGSCFGEYERPNARRGRPGQCTPTLFTRLRQKPANARRNIKLRNPSQFTLVPVRPRSCERPPYPTTTTFPPYLAGVARTTPDKWGEGGSFGEYERPNARRGRPGH